MKNIRLAFDRQPDGSDEGAVNPSTMFLRGRLQQ